MASWLLLRLVSVSSNFKQQEKEEETAPSNHEAMIFLIIVFGVNPCNHLNEKIFDINLIHLIFTI